MLKIRNVKTITSAVKETDKASYELDYTVSDNELVKTECKVMAIVQVTTNGPEGPVEVPAIREAGTLTLEHGRITPSAFAADLPIAEYLTVFGELVKEITPKEAEVIKTK